MDGSGSGDLASAFSPEPGVAYLDSATYGLAPDATAAVMQAAIRAWQAGTANWIDDWDRPADDARAAFADLAGLPVANVAIVPTASVGIGPIAATLTRDDEIVVPEDEFTSVLFPLLTAERVGASVVQAPFDRLVDAISERTTLVASSVVQMQTGRVLDVEAVLGRAAEVGARTLLDATQALPFVAGDGALRRADFVVCSAYKHLLCPRGVGFLVVTSEQQDTIPTWNANWRAADDPYGRYFGGPLTLAADARRFDVSVAWLPFVGAARSLELLRGWSGDGLLRGPLNMAEQLAEWLGVEWHGSTLVSVPVSSAEAARTALDEARIRASIRGQGVRLSPHVYTAPDDLDRAATALRPLVTG